MTEDKKRRKEFKLGVSLMVGFLVVLVLLFMPLFNGHNGMEYMDNMYNSISKGSANYMSEMKEVAQGLEGESLDYTLKFGSELQAQRVAVLLAANGAKTSVQGAQVQMQGDLGELMLGAVSDAKAMYHNEEEAVTQRYDYPGQAAIYNWWTVTQTLDSQLNKDKRYTAAVEMGRITNRALEVAYNYYGVKPEKIMNQIGVVLGSLVFYVIYTLWYGFAILFMLEGGGFRLEH